MEEIGSKEFVRLSKARKLALSFKKEGTVVDHISGRALKYLADMIDDLMHDVLEEAMKGNYYTMAEIDIKRGFDKWLRKKAREADITK